MPIPLASTYMVNLVKKWWVARSVVCGVLLGAPTATRRDRIRHFFTILIITILVGCAGPDYTPVYFPAPGGSNPPPAAARCVLQMTSKLCVKIKGEKLEAGIKPDDLICADAPPIPIEILGEKTFLKGSDFPDIQVEIMVKGVKTPMTMNGKGATDGSKNIGEGSWTPEGDIEIKNFSLFFNVLGANGEVPNLTWTTGLTKEVEGLDSLKGSPIGPDGKIKLVTSTILGHLFEAADKYLLGASLQASFEGKVDPPLSQCITASGDGEKQLRIVKLRLDSSGKLSEEALPGRNVLEVSQGTFIAQSPQDVGSSFETRASFKAIHEGDKPINIQLPARVGPFYFEAEGRRNRTLQPNASFKFSVIFRPTHNDTPKAGTIKQTFRLGMDNFFLSGVALEPAGRPSVHRVDESGQTIAANIETVILNPLFVPATTAKNFFKCQKIQCEPFDSAQGKGHESITQCTHCTPPEVQGCALKPINTAGKPIEEVDSACKPLYPGSSPLMALDLSGSSQIPLEASKQILTIRNTGVTDLTIKNIFIEEMPGSQSKGQFKFEKKWIRAGISFEKSEATTPPLTLPPYRKGVQEKMLFLSVVYLPNDLIGFDGKQATSGIDVIDKAILKMELQKGFKTTQLIGRTKIQDIPDLQAYFATATGLKAKANSESFAMQEVTAKTQDMAVPVFLKLSDTASGGLRITEIRMVGKDTNFFEWLDTPAKVESRQPPSGFGKRCSIPIIDPTTGRQIDERFDLTFVNIGSQGFDLKPGATTQDNMPLFGCVNYHKDPNATIRQRIFQTNLVVTALKLDAQGKLEKNPDGSYKQTQLTIPLVAAIDPLRGKFVARISQTGTAILNPQNPVLTAVPSLSEVEMMEKAGESGREELLVMLGALILDPFDEFEIKDSQDRVINKPGDGYTAAFRSTDTRPTTAHYDDEAFFDYTTLQHDSDLPIGKQGIFYDYDFSPEFPLPNPLKTNGWRIFTGSLSYPGPLSPRSPINLNECEVVDPCSPEGLRKFSKSGVGSDEKGACAFFFVSAGRYHSPTFEPIIRGESGNMCANREQPQDLIAMDNGHYSVDGSITLEDLGLRFWGPTFFHNPAGPLGNKPPLEEVLHIAFTTEILKPQSSPRDYNVIPDEKLDLKKQEHKLNLTDTNLTTVVTCPATTRNRTLGGKKHSSWRYFEPFIVKDEAGEIPAGCPEAENNFTGGTAFVHGRRIDPETGVFSLVNVSKFSSKEDLSLAFKDIVMFVILNGWVCNPQGDEKNFEGAKCFDPNFNERDAKAQVTMTGE